MLPLSFLVSEIPFDMIMSLCRIRLESMQIKNVQYIFPKEAKPESESHLDPDYEQNTRSSSM
jgi:hypothetical protein